MSDSDDCPPDNQPATEQEVRVQIDFALQPFGDRPNLAEAERATCWLLQHADAAYTVLLARARHMREPAVLELLARFDRAASTPVFADALRRDPPGGHDAAARALARAGDPAAAQVLLQCAADPRPIVAAAALDGLRLRGDAAACSAVRAQLGSPNARVRFSAVEAAGALGCLDRAALRQLASSDPDPDVRAVAAEMASERR